MRKSLVILFALCAVALAAYIFIEQPVSVKSSAFSASVPTAMGDAKVFDAGPIVTFAVNGLIFLALLVAAIVILLTAEEPNKQNARRQPGCV
jgi:hypothetical protein